MNSEYTSDRYDRLASWALGYGTWETYTRIKKTGLFNLDTKEVTTKYETVPVDTVALWKATGRNFCFGDTLNINLDEESQNLTIPKKYQSNSKIVRQLVAKELAFICMNTRSHLLPDNTPRKFTKEEIKKVVITRTDFWIN